MKTEAVFDLTVYSLLAGIIFARLTYFAVYRDQYSSWADLFRVWQGGLVSWGGFIVGISVYVVIVKLYREPIRRWLDLLAIGGLLGISIGRVGSFLSGEYAGKATSLPWSVQGLHPVTLYEAVILLLMFFLFLSLYLRRKMKREGIFFALTILLYSLVRFGLDFVRSDRSFWLGLTMTQVTSAIIILVIVGYLILKTTNREGARRVRS